MATWVSRSPAIRDELGASTAQMGLIIASMSVGSVLGTALGGLMVARFGDRAVMLSGLAANVAGILTVAVGVWGRESVVVAVGLGIFGCGMGSGEIAQNVMAIDLEIAIGRSIIPSFHGCYSLAVGFGGLLGTMANSLNLPVIVHLTLVSLASSLGIIWLAANARTPGPVGAESHKPAAQPLVSRAAPIWPDAGLMGIGMVILGMALAEGTANDWLPLITVDGFDSTAEAGSIIYAGFGLAMAIGRFTGGRLIDRFGRVPVMRASATLAALGIAVVVFSPSLGFAAIGVLLWGIGASLGFPISISAAGDHPTQAAHRTSFVATAGYVSFLVGPLLLGFLGQAVGLRPALLLVLVAVLGSLVCAGAVRARVANKTDVDNKRVPTAH